MKRFLILFLSLCALCACVDDKNPQNSAVSLEPDNNNQNMYQTYREMLSLPQRKAYDAIYNSYQSCKDKVTLDYMEKDELENLIRFILYDHPDIFYLADEYEYELDTVNQEYLNYHPKYRFTNEEVQKLNEQVADVVNPIIQEAKQKKDDYEKVKYVYDFVIDRSDYVESSKENQNILSVLLYKQSVCAGYAKSIQFILNQLQIPCAYITGYPRYGSVQPHAWNMLKMDGAYYYMDATNADPSDGEIGDEYRYIYFAMTKAEMLRLYVPDYEEICMDATSSKDNYFARNQAYFTTFDTVKLDALIDKALEKPEFSFIVQSDNAQTARELDQYIQENEYLFNKTGISQFHYYELGELNTHVYIPVK